MSYRGRHPPLNCLTIAGWDPTGGAGVVADCQTFWQLGARASAVLTTITAQNARRVESLKPLPAPHLEQQLRMVVADSQFQAVKIGLLASAAQVRLLAGWMERFSGHPLVLDPVMWSSSGTRLCSPATVTALRKWLLPLVSAITPNAREAGALLGRQVSGSAGRRRAAAELSRRGPLVVLTGGDSFGDPVDYLGQQGEVVELPGRRLPGTARGTGCRFSSVLAVLLARGLHAAAAVRRAAAFTRKYIEQSR
ncbi:MAG: bifunctional hydroxymethylpyrimidine kinase/phosphomethylpyrimidine kinase [Deltaproteobacteria bacterium]|nr:MAG: bifunctional hydroxymethylpyrimidine kinase/phosphomethylpyrimidine kinase [Deltaproteobacteria bacterium]